MSEALKSLLYGDKPLKPTPTVTTWDLLKNDSSKPLQYAIFTLKFKKQFRNGVLWHSENNQLHLTVRKSDGNLWDYKAEYLMDAMKGLYPEIESAQLRPIYPDVHINGISFKEIKSSIINPDKKELLFKKMKQIQEFNEAKNEFLEQLANHPNKEAALNLYISIMKLEEKK